MALPSLGSIGKVGAAAAGGVASGALRVARNTTMAGVGAVLSQSPMTAMLIGLLGSGISQGKKTYDKLLEKMEQVEEYSDEIEENTEELVKEAKKETRLSKEGNNLFKKMLGFLEGIRNVIANQFMKQRRSSVLASMRNFKLPTLGAASAVPQQEASGGMGFFGKLGIMMLAKRFMETIGTGLLAATGAAMAGGALIKGLGKLVWTVGKKAIRFAGPVGLAIGIGMSMFDGILDAFEEYRKSGNLGEALIKGVSSFFSDLTFGIISKEQVEGVIRPIVESIGSAIKWVADMADDIGTTLSDAATRVEGWYRELVNKIPSWDDIVKFFPEWVQEFFKKQDPNAPRAKPIEGELNSRSVSGIGFSDTSGDPAPDITPRFMTRDEKEAYIPSLRNRLRILEKEKEQLREQIDAQRNIAKDSAKISTLASAPRMYSSGILQAIENPERAAAGNKDMAEAMKYAFSLMSRGGLLDTSNPVHQNMESLFAYGNKGIFSGKSQKEKQGILESMMKEFSALFTKDKGNLAEIELESRAALDKRLKEVSKGQEETEKTIREMLSNSPPFLMTIRDAILGQPNTPSVYTDIIEILDDIYDAIVETTRLFSGRPDWDPRAITLGNGRFSEYSGVPTSGQMRRSRRSGGPSGQGSGVDIETGPGVQGMLDYIGRLESKGNYNALVYGNGTPKENPNLTNMTISEVMDYQKGMKSRGHASSAVGKYQFIRNTLAGVVKQAGIDPSSTKFTPEIQDKLATMLMEGRGLNAFLSGKITPEQFADNLAKEWASLPMSNGLSYYAGDKEGNKSGASRGSFLEQVGKTKNEQSLSRGLPAPAAPGSGLVDQNRRIEALSNSVRPGSAPDAPPPTVPPIVVSPPVMAPQASSGRTKNVSGFSTMPVRNSEWDFRKWNTDSMLRAMA